MIKCPECNSDMCELDEICPNCGYKFEDTFEIKQENEYIFNGVRGTNTVTIENDYISIKRNVGMQNIFLGLKGEKRINIRNISAVEIKKAGWTWGYLRFILVGGQENINEMQDENSITIYNQEQYNQAIEIREYIEKHNKQEKDDDGILDKIEKLAELKEKGIITESEFINKKTELLKKI